MSPRRQARNSDYSASNQGTVQRGAAGCERKAAGKGGRCAGVTVTPTAVRV